MPSSSLPPALRAFRYVYYRALPLRQQSEVAPSLDETVARIDSSAARVYSAHEHRAVDDRSHTHLYMASLALGTYRTLAPLLQHDEERTLSIIRQGFGLLPQKDAFRLWPNALMVRLSLLLSRDATATKKRMAENFARDMGDAFDCEMVSRSPAAAPPSSSSSPPHFELLVHRCLYNDVFRAERAEVLTRMFCALDAANFAGMRGFALDETLADDKCRACRFQFR